MDPPARSVRPAAMAPTPTMVDKWELLSLLGSGGMAEVWLARHAVMGREAAVKIMREAMARDEREVARFVQEAQIAGKLAHPNVVRVEDVGRAADGRPYLVMERLHGESLEDRFDRVRVFSPGETLALLGQAAAALQAAHEAGVVHRDVKPANLFLARENGTEVLKVLDFGLARVMEDGSKTATGRRLTELGRTVGTPLYMSPEQATGKSDIDARSDLWALAVIAYEMLTGAHPFLDDEGGDVRVAVVRAKFMAPSARNPALGPALDAWMARALARNREDRFGSANELFAALERALAAPAHFHPEGYIRGSVPSEEPPASGRVHAQWVTDPGVGRPVGATGARLSAPPASAYSREGSAASVETVPSTAPGPRRRLGLWLALGVAALAVASLLAVLARR